jgi:predicted NUDIX family NTP pyrophosphohydrolase
MPDAQRRSRTSAGILLFRRTATGIEVLLGHPGGPYFERRDAAVWSIPKGEAAAGEELWAVAKREFGEETGHVIGSSARTIELGSVTQRGGKVVHAWAVEGNLDPANAWSNTFSMEWPPHSGIVIEVPEVDRVAWFDPDAARVAMNPAQAVLVDLLLESLGDLAAPEASGTPEASGASDASGTSDAPDAPDAPGAAAEEST